MKISKRQLRRIIKEENRKLLSESDFDGLESDIFQSVSSINKGSMKMTPEKMQRMTVSFIDDALYTVQRQLGGVVSPEDFAAAVMQSAKEWTEY
jgi:hypothetical protein